MKKLTKYLESNQINRRNENKNSSQKMHIKQIEQQTDEKKKTKQQHQKLKKKKLNKRNLK